MDKMLTPEDIVMARKILGLRGTGMKARKNHWDFVVRENHTQNIKALDSLARKGYLDYNIPLGQPTPKGVKRYMFLNDKGIQQLKLQIGEFYF